MQVEMCVLYRPTNQPIDRWTTYNALPLQFCKRTAADPKLGRAATASAEKMESSAGGVTIAIAMGLSLGSRTKQQSPKPNQGRQSLFLVGVWLVFRRDEQAPLIVALACLPFFFFLFFDVALAS